MLNSDVSMGFSGDSKEAHFSYAKCWFFCCARDNSGKCFEPSLTTAQVVETPVTNNSLSKDYLHPDDHADS